MQQDPFPCQWTCSCYTDWTWYLPGGLQRLPVGRSVFTQLVKCNSIPRHPRTGLTRGSPLSPVFYSVAHTQGTWKAWSNTDWARCSYSLVGDGLVYKTDSKRHTRSSQSVVTIVGKETMQLSSIETTCKHALAQMWRQIAAEKSSASVTFDETVVVISNILWSTMDVRTHARTHTYIYKQNYQQVHTFHNCSKMNDCIEKRASNWYLSERANTFLTALV